MTDECTYCANQLNDEERESPQLDADGDVMCDDCYDEHFRDYCGRCDEKVDKSDLDSAPEKLIGVWTEDSGLEPGYYRVKSWPFYADGMIVGFFYKHALEYVAKLDEVGLRCAKEANYASGPMCENCQKLVDPARAA